MNRRRKRRDDNAPLRLREDLFKRRNHSLQKAFDRNGRVRRIGEQRQHAVLSVTAKRPQIDRLTDHRCLVYFVIAGMNDRADRRLDAE